MPFLPSETFSNTVHRGHGALRILLRMAPNYFVERLNRQGLALTVVLDSNKKPIPCHLCGFALARLELKSGWLMEACSATGFASVRKNSYFVQWASELKEFQDPKSIIELKVGQNSVPVALDSSTTSY